MPGLTPSGRALSLLKAALRRLAGLGGWRLVLAQVLGTLLVVYLALEGWARLFPPKDQMVWPLVQDPAVGSRFQANSRVVLSNGLDFRVEERTNEAGFLDRPLPPVARTAGTCRIAFLGDSFVEAAQVPNAQKVQAELERLMKARWPALGVETMAFGFSGTGQLNQLGYLEAYVRPRKPDLIVSIGGGTVIDTVKIALVCLAATPLLYGHGFINPKDSPFAWLTLWALYYACRILANPDAPERKALTREELRRTDSPRR